MFGSRLAKTGNGGAVERFSDLELASVATQIEEYFREREQCRAVPGGFDDHAFGNGQVGLEVVGGRGLRESNPGHRSPSLWLGSIMAQNAMRKP